MSDTEIPWLHWYEDPAKLAELWRWLEDRGEVPADPAEFMEEPWHWAASWQAMQVEAVA